MEAAALVAPPSPLLRAAFLKSTGTGAWKVNKSLALLHADPVNVETIRCRPMLSSRFIALHQHQHQHQGRRIRSLPEIEPVSVSSPGEDPLPVSQQEQALAVEEQERDASLPQSQATKGTVNSITEEISDSSKYGSVKFMLSKECSFGERFLLVGDDSRLGQWDPSKAIPLEWSDDHIWITELELPANKTFLFKFIHQTTSGNIKWQSGPDRVLKTWETANVITVSDDWENAEKLKITEDLQKSKPKITMEEDKGVIDENFQKVDDENNDASLASDKAETDIPELELLAPEATLCHNEPSVEETNLDIYVASSVSQNNYHWGRETIGKLLLALGFFISELTSRRRKKMLPDRGGMRLQAIRRKAWLV